MRIPERIYGDISQLLHLVRRGNVGVLVKDKQNMHQIAGSPKLIYSRRFMSVRIMAFGDDSYLYLLTDSSVLREGLSK